LRDLADGAGLALFFFTAGSSDGRDCIAFRAFGIGGSADRHARRRVHV
jgi:hypothetical protein